MDFPFYQQHETMDCGPACLRMIAHAYGRKHSLQHLRELSNISRRGVNLRGIGDAAESIGLRTLGVRTSFEKLSKKANLPCIIHWRQAHFVVVYRIETKKMHNKSAPWQTWVVRC
jgi:ATP-binding cassette subfamily B protein